MPRGSREACKTSTFPGLHHVAAEWRRCRTQVFFEPINDHLEAPDVGLRERLRIPGNQLHRVAAAIEAPTLVA